MLNAHAAPTSWSPDLIDIALDHSAAEAAFEEICVSVVEHCERPLTVVNLRKPNGQLLLDWLRNEARRKICCPNLRDDAVAVLHQLARESARRFVPTRPVSDGWLSNGFQPYLRLNFRGLRKSLARTYAPCAGESLDAERAEGDTLHDSLPGRVRDHDRALSNALLQALRTAIESPSTWDCVFWMAYRGKSLRELAIKAAIPRSSMSRRVAAPFVERLNRLLRPYADGLPTCAGAELEPVTRAIARFLSADEFRELIPRPTKNWDSRRQAAS